MKMKVDLNFDVNLKIVFLSIIPVLLMILFMDNAIFDSPGYLDSPLYISYGLNYLDADVGNQYYKISRLPWIWFQFFFRALFNPEVASVLIFFVINFSIVYLTIKLGDKLKYKGVFRIFAVSLPFLLSIYDGGPNYHNSFSILLTVIMIYYTFKISHEQDSWRSFFNIGVIHALILYSNLTIVLDAALYCFLIYIAVKISNNQNPIKNWYKKALFVICGELSLTFLLGFINLLVGRKFLFMDIFWKFVFKFSSSGPSKWKHISNFIDTPHLSFIFVSVLFSVLVILYNLLSSREKRNNVVIFVNIANLLVFSEILLSYLFRFNLVHVPYMLIGCIFSSAFSSAFNFGYILRNRMKEECFKSHYIILSLLSLFLLYVYILNGNMLFGFKNNFLNLSIFFSLIIAIICVLKAINIRLFNFLFNPLILIYFISLIYFSSYQISGSFIDLGKNSYKSYDCSEKRAVHTIYNQVQDRFYPYFRYKDKSNSKNIFFWYNRESKVEIDNLKCEGYKITRPLEKIHRSLVMTSFTEALLFMPLDNPFKDGESVKMKNLWKNVDSYNDARYRKNNFLKYYNEERNGKRIVIIVSDKESDAKIFIRNMRKKYRLNFKIVESSRIYASPYIIKYNLLIQE